MTSVACDTKLPYVCVKTPLYRDWDNACPSGYRPYKGECYLGDRFKHNFQEAQVVSNGAAGTFYRSEEIPINNRRNVPRGEGRCSPPRARRSWPSWVPSPPNSVSFTLPIGFLPDKL